MAIEPKINIIHLRRNEFVQRTTGMSEFRIAATGGLTVAYYEKDDALIAAVARCNMKSYDGKPPDTYSRKAGAHRAKELLMYPETLFVIKKDSSVKPRRAVTRVITSQKQLMKNLRTTVVYKP